MTKRGKHAKDLVETDEGNLDGVGEILPEYDSDYSPTADSVQATMGKVSGGRKRRRALVIVASLLVGLVVCAYAAGFVAFSLMFFPNTHVGEDDISLLTDEQVAALLDEVEAGYSFTVEGQGVSLAMSAHDAGIVFDDEAILAKMRSRNPAWAWPYEVFQSRDLSDCVFIEYENDALEIALRDACAVVNETATPPIDATIGYDASVDGVVVVAEQYGTLLDPDEVVEYVKAENAVFEEAIALPDDVLVEAALTKEDERLVAAAQKANTFLTVDVDFLIGGQVAVSVDPESMSTWILMDDDFDVSLDESLKEAWIAQTVEGCSTVGSSRTYTRPDGKEITVEGGDYGWKVDEEAFESMILEALDTEQQGEFDMPVTQTAQSFNGYGVADWGKRYVDIDLSEQHAYFYDSDGELIWESDIVSGGPGASRATPTGVWDLNTNNGYAMLVGRRSDGSIDYETPVSYWMPFVRQSIGLHDANWRGSFGGTIYTYNGSHGCVNLPVGKARELHQIIEVGDVVISHW